MEYQGYQFTHILIPIFSVYIYKNDFMKKHLNPTLRILVKITLCFLIGISVVSFVQSVLLGNRLEYLYDLPTDDLATHLDEGSSITWGSITTSLENTLTYYAFGVSGVERIEQNSSLLQIDDPGYLIVDIHSMFGAGKLAVYSPSQGLIVADGSQAEIFIDTPGTYSLYCVGSHFWGKLEIALTSKGSFLQGA